MTFDTVLIANRGEIACRVIETARKMGLRTIAVFSDADARARHVALADEAVRIGPADPLESYLNIDTVIAAAKASGAGAVHPGYGFLSENPEFVDAVVKAGLIFVGPSGDAIRAMGLKDAAKSLMVEAGVPVVPGYSGEDQSLARLETEAAEVGYPVLIKAVAGGGGKGMRRVSAPEDFAAALASAQAEARTAFGNERVLIEKFVAKPRHIEVQIFGDGTDAVHLFERDCSLQRRHQKVIEEAPAPGMTDEMRNAMGQAAVRAAKAVGYAGAGTVEFIVDGTGPLRPDGFWFMEMNTRLQVEHPVTEEITGVDLVAWQLRVAQGEALPASQNDLSIQGHAMEARIYAEDTGAGFLPATGHLAHLIFPDDARIDTGVRQGDTVTSHYDPMIAKLTVHGATREDARRALSAALGRTDIAGIVTNVAFLKRLVDVPRFVAGDVDTGLIESEGADLAVDPAPSPEAIAIAAVCMLRLDDPVPLQGFTLWQGLTHYVHIADTEVSVTPHDSGAIVRSTDWSFDVANRDGNWFLDGRATQLRAVSLPDEVVVFGPGGGRFGIVDPLERGGAGEGVGSLEAPMPGRVTSVSVAAGDQVAAGDVLLALEAMKMEHLVIAGQDGLVADVYVVEGDQVQGGQALVRLETEEPADDRA